MYLGAPEFRGRQQKVWQRCTVVSDHDLQDFRRFLRSDRRAADRRAQIQKRPLHSGPLEMDAADGQLLWRPADAECLNQIYSGIYDQSLRKVYLDF